MIIRRPEGSLLEKKFTKVDWPADINYIEMTPSVMSYDDNKTGVTGGQIFNIIECFDFSPSLDGRIWFSFNFPKKWQISRDMNIETYYSLDGIDYATQVNLSLRLWVINLGQSASEVSPNLLENVQITTSETNTGVYQKYGIPVSNELFLSKDCIVCGGFTRESQTDNYSGVFKLAKMVIRQI